MEEEEADAISAVELPWSNVLKVQGMLNHGGYTFIFCVGLIELVSKSNQLAVSMQTKHH